MSNPSIAIIGPGGVGSVFTTHLINLGHDVLACARRPFDEFIIETLKAELRAPADVVIEPAEAAGRGPVDWLFVGLKGHQTDGAAAWFAELSGPNTTIVTLQNGVEGVERMEPHGNGAHVVPAVVYCEAELVAPGHVIHRSAARLVAPNTKQGHALAELFAGSPARIDATDAHLNEAFYKLAVNVVFNGVTALANKPLGVLRTGAMPQLVQTLVEEVFEVARAEGSTLNKTDVERFMAGVSKVSESGLTSMLQDRRAGRPSEVDAIHSAVTRLGIKHSIPTPLTTAVGALVAAGDPA
jgi:2-dehydropantoate 2-reductase